MRDTASVFVFISGGGERLSFDENDALNIAQVQGAELLAKS
jgi:hypothetical protein